MAWRWRSQGWGRAALGCWAGADRQISLCRRAPGAARFEAPHRLAGSSHGPAGFCGPFAGALVPVLPQSVGQPTAWPGGHGSRSEGHRSWWFLLIADSAGFSRRCPRRWRHGRSRRRPRPRSRRADRGAASDRCGRSGRSAGRTGSRSERAPGASQLLRSQTDQGTWPCLTALSASSNGWCLRRLTNASSNSRIDASSSAEGLVNVCALKGGSG